MTARFKIGEQWFQMNAMYSTADENDIGMWHHARSTSGSSCEVLVQNNRPVEVKMLDWRGAAPGDVKPEPAKPSDWIWITGDHVETIVDVTDAMLEIPFGGIAVPKRTKGTITAVYDDGWFDVRLPDIPAIGILRMKPAWLRPA